MTIADPLPKIERWRLLALWLGSGATLLSIVGFVFDREQFLRSYLFAFILWVGLGLGCLGTLLLHHTVGGKWGMPIRRMSEAGARTLPFLAILIIPILLNVSALYPWARPEASHDPIIQAKSAYLNLPGVVGRSIVYFLVWTFYALRLSTLSARQDASGNVRLATTMKSLSAPGLVIFTFTATFAFIDWIMSLEPHWFSTMYGAIFLVGQVLESLAFVIALAIVLSAYAPLRGFITPQHFHDLGNLMFAFMVLWAYLAFSQFLIIWSGNLPNEIPWYLHRLRGGWGWVALALVIFHFATPFVLLLMRRVKRNANRLFRVCLLLLAARAVDVYWTVMPAFFQGHFRIHWLDFTTPVAVGGFWLALFFWQLNSRPPLPLQDPQLQGAPRETVAY